MRTPHRVVAVLGLLCAGCAPVEPAPGTTVARVDEVPVLAQDTSPSLPPVGYGTLRQDEFSVEIRDASLNLKFTPLSEAVIRLAAPDTYERLHALARSRRARAQAMTEGHEAAMFLVSFFSREPNVAYRPEGLRLAHRGRTMPPAGIVPLTTGWGQQLLQPEQTQSAIYVFPAEIDYELPIILRYDEQQSDDWHRVILPRLEAERTRVESRAGTRGP